jgi:hypothetical protein
MTGIIVALVLIVAAIEGLRWAWHRYFGAPLDPAAERERHLSDLKLSWRVSKGIAKHYLRR